MGGRPAVARGTRPTERPLEEPLDDCSARDVNLRVIEDDVVGSTGLDFSDLESPDWRRSPVPRLG